MHESCFAHCEQHDGVLSSENSPELSRYHSNKTHNIPPSGQNCSVPPNEAQKQVFMTASNINIKRKTNIADIERGRDRGRIVECYEFLEEWQYVLTRRLVWCTKRALRIREKYTLRCATNRLFSKFRGWRRRSEVSVSQSLGHSQIFARKPAWDSQREILMNGDRL